MVGKNFKVLPITAKELYSIHGKIQKMPRSQRELYCPEYYKFLNDKMFDSDKIEYYFEAMKHINSIRKQPMGHHNKLYETTPEWCYPLVYKIIYNDSLRLKKNVKRMSYPPDGYELAGDEMAIENSYETMELIKIWSEENNIKLEH
jgi:hypothetical protein